ncbi:hypothetical protein F8388_023462 [Cannabis sativa]|uniref:Reverse transcriptase zinc-binding domain-containing protein n=1 Tax=Cannabis sativa TaxID=3483 RepID=A0A7J6FKR8_CANSA|nr:hypothetical protein F8388_023462 [Cannabis sativa]
MNVALLAKLAWDSEVGAFSVKGAYLSSQKSRLAEKQDLWNWIWNCKIHPRQSMMLWRAVARALPTSDKYGRTHTNDCLFCSSDNESPLHIFKGPLKLPFLIWMASAFETIWLWRNRIRYGRIVKISVDEMLNNALKPFVEMSDIHKPSSEQMLTVSNSLPVPGVVSKAKEPSFQTLQGFHQTSTPDFDFRSDILGESNALIAKSHPELLDLASSGNLVLIEKRLFGPVPPWRAEFVEPETIWLVGTTHISQESAMEVERVVRAIKPDNVVVELCRSRQSSFSELGLCTLLMVMSKVQAYDQTCFFERNRRSTALALRLLLAVFSSKLSSDFRAARKASEEVGAQIVLGDRPIEITLERAWNSLTWTEKLGLVTSVVLSGGNQVQMTARFQLYEKLSFSYPNLLQPLIHERDTYLAWSLKRSKAVNKSKSVVGVIGKGHMNGVIYALVSDQGNLRFRDVAGKSLHLLLLILMAGLVISSRAWLETPLLASYYGSYMNNSKTGFRFEKYSIFITLSTLHFQVSLNHILGG